MKRSTLLKAFVPVVLFCLFPVAKLHAWDEGYYSLILPVKSDAKLAIEPEITTRLFQVIPPDRAGFRIADGVILFNTMRVGLAYCTIWKELSAEVSGWFTVGDFRFGGAAEGIWADDPAAPLTRYWSAAVTLYGTGWIVHNLLNVAFNVQYDFYFQRLNGGLGLSLSVIPDALSVVAEGMISPLGEFSWAWTAGILIKTAGHQFLIYVGNGNDPRMRNILSDRPAPGEISFGVGLRRKIDIIY